MRKEDWANSQNAQEMLRALNVEQPDYLQSQIAQLHKYLIACSWKHKHLIPQLNLRNGLKGAEKWLAGDLSNEVLNNLNWYAEAEAFKLDYAKTPEEIIELREMFAGVSELDDMTFSRARQLMNDAAYFAEGSMMYSTIDKLPWVGSLFTSQFLCPDLLRSHLEPNF